MTHTLQPGPHMKGVHFLTAKIITRSFFWLSGQNNLTVTDFT